MKEEEEEEEEEQEKEKEEEEEKEEKGIGLVGVGPKTFKPLIRESESHQPEVSADFPTGQGEDGIQSLISVWSSDSGGRSI
ncbi:uncharacterized protein PADG_04914 [Paracoccidioides brasiliensis Pb18]|uniref:Uncharacterized protein n=1 Tax=Paracoccidioides brasiliensis (strain Pb18) TaxID=502780 RepID=C1GBB3_PARBD|nr:uncharacterized protein PADG_04914 [Paracoccidioides brasiliensis Pb18]EEH48835.2 hypothetical protein PADG_04914 [Paracoccidioides brasiliensis Pb18]